MRLSIFLGGGGGGERGEEKRRERRKTRKDNKKRARAPLIPVPKKGRSIFISPDLDRCWRVSRSFS